MSTLTFCAQPLTPIHIGTGERIAPEEYLLAGNDLVRFSTAAVLRDMSPRQQAELQRLLNNNEFTKAQAVIRHTCDPARHGFARCEVGASSRYELSNILQRPERRCEIHPFVRNPGDGRPYLPGSSLKGAIRTAVVNHFTQKHQDEVYPAVQSEQLHKQGQALEEEVFNRRSSETERDPLRLLKVPDVPLSPGCIRLDRAIQWKKGDVNDARKGMQMHFERLRCRQDDADFYFKLTLHFDEAQVEHRQVKSLFGRLLDWPLIQKACNQFYWGRLNAELNKFYPQGSEIYQKIKGGIAWQDANGRKVLAPPPWKDRLLLRVGRFSHFESLSVDKLRNGHRPQAKNPRYNRILDEEMGSTRTLCEYNDEGDRLPFGWLLLTYVK
jgi:CRISPR-associated protein Csm5